MIRGLKPTVLSSVILLGIGLSSLVLLMNACSASLHAQRDPQPLAAGQSSFSDKEKEKITQTIEMYFEGWMIGDTTLLGKAMHRTCKLKNIKDDDVIIFDRATYLGFFKPRSRRENAGGKIVFINITDDIASAKCEIHTKDRLFTDYFNMMKIKGDWYIVDKIATNKARSDK
jgi:hypothetical protein